MVVAVGIAADDDEYNDDAAKGGGAARKEFEFAVDAEPNVWSYRERLRLRRDKSGNEFDAWYKYDGSGVLFIYCCCWNEKCL